MIRQLILLISLTLTSCSSLSFSQNQTEADTTPRWIIHEERCRETRPDETRIDISLANRTAQLLRRDGVLLAEMDISPGVPGHLTPAGTFPIREKLAAKRSNLYGQYVRPETGEVIVARAWEHPGPPPPGTVYQGILMPWWLRLTDDGVGMHEGKFPRSMASSHGCIRCPEEPQHLVWQLSQKGTPVTIHESTHPHPSQLTTSGNL